MSRFLNVNSCLKRSSRLAYTAPRQPVWSSRRLVSTKRYTEAHEWIATEDGSDVATMGISDYAQNSLGDAVFVELPVQGAEVAQGDQIGAVESVKAASDIFAPISGTIAEINSTLGNNPGLINKSPESDGWLCKIKFSEKSELDKLLDAAAYKRHCEGADD